MDLTKEEVEITQAAVKSMSSFRWMPHLLFLALIVILLMMLFGLLSGEQFAYMAVPMVFLSAMWPQLRGAPKYAQLVGILERHLPQRVELVDILAQEVKEHGEVSKADG